MLGKRKRSYSGNTSYRRQYKKRRMSFKRQARRGFAKKSSSGRGVTTQHDSRIIYKKSWMPKWKKRAWSRFSRKVKAAQVATEGTRSVVFNTTNEDSAIFGDVIRNQVIMTCALYGLRATNPLPIPNGYSDILQILGDDTDIPYQGKVMFRSGVLDVTFVNHTVAQTKVSADPEVWDEIINPGRTLELDIYEIWYYKDRHKYIDLQTALREDTGDEVPGTSTLTIDKMGSTPFDFPQAISNLGFKVIKKTKYFLGYNQGITYQMRDARNHIVDKYEVLDDSFAGQFVSRKLTKGLLAIGQALPEAVDGLKRIQIKLNTSVTRKYAYVNYSTETTKEKTGYIKDG